MEAYFHKDSRIEEWVDQIIEKVFTVCLLTGVDSEAEFQRGCQIVTKVTSVLQGISMFPSEYLEDGLKQLLEQQLPDARVINNFPAFQDTMDKMLREGMAKVFSSQNRETLKTVIATNNENSGEQLTEDYDHNTARAEEVGNKELLTESVIAALASVDCTCSENHEIEAELLDIELDEPRIISSNTIEQAIIEDNTLKVATVIEPTIISKAYGMLRTSQIPEYADSLKRVLSNIFPNGSVNWNKILMGQTFLAQVENILICLADPEHPCRIEELTKEGWKVFVCSSEDLTFPRRLERGIKQIQRSRKKSQIV